MSQSRIESLRFFNRMRRLAVFAVPAMLAFPITGAWAQQPAPFKIGVLSGHVGDGRRPVGTGYRRSGQARRGGFWRLRPQPSIQVLEADHLNKPDVGVHSGPGMVYDEGVSAIFDIGLTSIALGVQELARDKNKLVVFLSSASSDLTRKEL